MKTDVARLPGELSKMPSVSIQLKMDELSTFSKLAKGGTAPPPISQSVITQAPPATSTGKADGQSKSPKVALKEQVIEKKIPQPLPMIAPMPPQTKKVTTATNYQVAYATNVPTTRVGSVSAGAQVQLPPGSGLAVQTADGNLVVYSMSTTNTTQSLSIVQEGCVAGGMPTVTSTSSSGGQQQAYTLGVPAYLDGSSLYQTLQLVPSAANATVAAAASGQQVVYWPTSMVGTTQNPVAAQGATVATGTGGTSQLAVVQHRPGLQPVQFGVEQDGASAGKTSSVITID